MELAIYGIAVLLLVILFAPLRLAYIALLLLAFFDASGPTFASASTLGVLNSAKVILAPLIIILRTRLYPIRLLYERKAGLAFVLFVLLTVYAALASLWSPFFLSAAKMIGYMAGHILWFSVLAYGIARGHLTPAEVAVTVAGGVVLGFAQTYGAGNTFGVDGYGIDFRFTAFTSAQSYAAFYGYVLALLLFCYPRRLGLLLSALSIFAIIAAGSRYSFLMSMWTVLIWVAYYLQRSANVSVFAQRAISVIVVALGALVAASAISPYLREHRIAEVAGLISGEIEGIGTLAWRLGMYQETIQQIQEFDALRLVFGSGTASGAVVALNYDPTRYDVQTIDANRVIHNEFLRALYEWGLLGLTLLILWVFSVLGNAVYMVMRKRTEGYLLLSVFGLLLGGLLIENILASSGSPVGIGLALVLAKVWIQGPMYVQNRGNSHPLPATRR